MNYAIATVALVLCFVLKCQSVSAELVFNNFSDTDGLQLNGEAATVGNTLRLSNASTFSRGSVFSQELLQLGGGASFSTFFQFEIGASGGLGDGDGAGADGLAFVVQTQANNVGTAGGFLGYSGIPNSLGIEFDTFDNGTPFGDPDGNHVGIDLDGSIVSLATLSEPNRFNNGSVWNAWIDYNGITDVVEARWSQGLDRPADSMLSLVVDLPTELQQNEAFVGFTSATGNGFGNHDLLRWEFRGEFRPIGVPEPSSSFLLTVAGVGLLLLRRTRREVGGVIRWRTNKALTSRGRRTVGE